MQEHNPLHHDFAYMTLITPLFRWLNTPQLVELSVTQPQEVWLEIAGQGYERHEAPELTDEYWLLLCHVLANHDGIPFGVASNPRLSTTLPGGHRFEALLGKNVEHGLSVSIRVQRNLPAPLEAFGLEGALKSRLISLVEQRNTIVISGGTSSGKTTFMNQLILHIPRVCRILTVEDAREVYVPHENRTHYLINRTREASLGYAEMIDHLMRSRPDIIIAGEVSIYNALPIIRLLSSGHAGFMCTVHAESAMAALNAAIPLNIRLAGLQDSGIPEALRQLVDVVVQLNRTHQGARRVTEFWFPKTGEHIALNERTGV